ncbi:MAG: cation:dicarboxylase symporter family transporter, partial [Pseudomonas mandelii]|uniref:cation:dicarboxylate symporter family transporter n=2 Tax=Pseudomonas TaxID=286 RepID=UPI003C719C92
MEISKSRWYSQLYVQVLIGIVIGAAIGHFEPQFGAKLQPFADGFIRLIKMLLAPIIFGTVVVGIAKMGSIKEVGRIGVKSLLYFEVLSTIALVIGLIVVNVVKPGVGMNINVDTLDGSSIAKYSQAASEQGGTVDFFMNII